MLFSTISCPAVNGNSITCKNKQGGLPPHGFALPSSNNGIIRAGRSASPPQEKGPQIKTCRVMINHGPRTGKENAWRFIQFRDKLGKGYIPSTPQPKNFALNKTYNAWRFIQFRDKLGKGYIPSTSQPKAL